MLDTKQLLRETRDRIAPPPDVVGSLERRRRRGEQVRRGSAIVLAIVIAVVGLGGWFAVTREVPEVVGEPSPTTPTITRRGGEFIVFAPSTTGPGWDLAAQDPRTGDVRTIVETDGIVDCVVGGEEPCTTFVKEAEWSPDGRWVAFRVTHRSLFGSPLGPCRPSVGLWVATDDDAPKQLTKPCDEPPSASNVAIEEMWAWSPMGDRLAYVRIDGETDELFVIDPSDGRRTSLGTGDVAPEYVPGWGRLASSLAWSPDGSRIAYADGGSVYLVGVETGERALLADSFDFRITSIAFSPDGTQLLVNHQILDRGRCCLGKVQVMNADGSDLHVVVDGEDGSPEKVRWSPSGDRIVYQLVIGSEEACASASCADDTEVWTVSPDGSDRIKVFDSAGCDMHGNDAEPVWAPDGRRVAFNDCGTWMIAHADGTGTPEPIDHLVWRSWYGSGLNGGDPAAIGPGIGEPSG